MTLRPPNWLVVVLLSFVEDHCKGRWQPITVGRRGGQGTASVAPSFLGGALNGTGRDSH